jgi:hypothetical protein
VASQHSEFPSVSFDTAAIPLRVQPVWPDSQRPRRLHSCNRMSRMGSTKKAPKIAQGIIAGDQYIEEFCPCGGSREWVLYLQPDGSWSDGEPVGKWLNRNLARKDKGWATREQNKLDSPRVKYI